MNQMTRNLATSTSPVPIPLRLSQPIHLPPAVVEAMCNNKYNYVSIRNGKWKELQLTNIIKYVIEWAIDNALFLCKNQEPNIIKMVEHVRFSNLRKLDLSANSIQSIETIGNIYFPCLEKLNLKNNQIMSFLSLRRIKALNLQSIDISGNCCNQLNSFSELYTQKLRQISLEDDYDDAGFGNDCRALAKLESSDLQMLWVLSKSRIQQGQFYGALQRRIGSVSKDIVQIYRPQIEM